MKIKDSEVKTRNAKGMKTVAIVATFIAIAFCLGAYFVVTAMFGGS